MTPTIKLTLITLILAQVVVHGIKTIIWFKASPRPPFRKYLLLPVFSTQEALAVVHGRQRLVQWRLFLRYLAGLGTLVLIYLWLWPMLLRSTPRFVWSVATWALAFVGYDAFNSAYQFFLRAAGYRHVPPLTVRPFCTASVREFFGFRWNRPVGAWAIELINASPHKITTALLIFLTQGVLHELCCNIPAYFLLHLNLVGTHVLCFLIAFLCLGVDRKLATYGRSATMRMCRYLLLVFLAVVTAPLFWNEALLKALWLWPRG